MPALFAGTSRAIFTRANSARKRLISICSAVTTDLPLTSFNFRVRCALTQVQQRLLLIFKTAGCPHLRSVPNPWLIRFRP